MHSLTDPKPPVPDKRTTKKLSNPLTKHKPASMAACTTSSAHQVNDNDKMSSLNYKVIGTLEHPPKVGGTADSKNISNVTDPLHSKHHDIPDDSSLNKKPRSKLLESASSIWVLTPKIPLSQALSLC